jgi:hypothetical protein
MVGRALLREQSKRSELVVVLAAEWRGSDGGSWRSDSTLNSAHPTDCVNVDGELLQVAAALV